MAETLAQVQAAYTVTLDGVTTVIAGDFTSANPINVAGETVLDVTSAYSISSQTVNSQNAGVQLTVDYTPIATDTVITNESLNRTAETLKASVNAALAQLKSTLDTSLLGVSGDTQTSLNSLVSEINIALAGIKADNASEVSEVNAKIAALIADINAGFAEVRSAESTQSTQIATKLNKVSSDLNAQDVALKAAIDEAFSRITALDDVFGTDADIANKVSIINSFIETLRVEDLDIVTAVDGVLKDLNAIERSFSKEITVSAASGVYAFDTLVEGLGQFASAADYTVLVDEVGNPQAMAFATEKTASGFNIRIKSYGVHFVPQPVDCSVTPAKVTVKISFSRPSLLVYGINELNASWISTSNASGQTSQVTIGQ